MRSVRLEKRESSGDWLTSERRSSRIQGANKRGGTLCDKKTAHSSRALFRLCAFSVCRPKGSKLDSSRRSGWGIWLSSRRIRSLPLLGDPPIMVLDEPTAGLDAAARRDVWNLINTVKKWGRTVILTTHYLEEAEFLSDHRHPTEGKTQATRHPR